VTFAVVSVHSPKPEFRDAVLDSMQRYSGVARRQPGLIWTGVVDGAGAELLGVAVWESEAAADAASPALRAEVGRDPFDQWDTEPIRTTRGTVR
jgi:hypothetical protein